jgi:hypothetical protein
VLPFSSLLQVNCSFSNILHQMPQLSSDLDFEFVCCVAHLLQSLILSLYVMCLCALELGSQASFKLNIVCVWCVRLLYQLLWILSCSLILKRASSSTLFVCYVFVALLIVAEVATNSSSELGRSCKLQEVH